jgi:hypothetical protein
MFILTEMDICVVWVVEDCFIGVKKRSGREAKVAVRLRKRSVT